MPLIFLKAQINIDSLKTQLNKIPNDSLGLKNLFEKAHELANHDFEAGIEAYKIAEQKAIAAKNQLVLGKVYSLMGTLYNNTEQFEQASISLLKAKDIAERIHNEELILNVNGNIGTMYYLNNQLQKALEVYYKVLSSADKFPVIKSIILNSIAGIKYDISWKIKDTANTKDSIRKAIPYLLRSTDIVEKLNSPNELTNRYNNLGLMYCDIAKYDSALYYLNKSKVLIDKHNFKAELAAYYNYTGRLHELKKEFDKAYDCYLKSIDIGKQTNIKEWVYENYLSLSELYEAKKDYKTALQYYIKYKNLRDTAINSENFSKAADIQNKYQREKKEKEIIKLSGDNKIQELQLEKDAAIRNRLIIIIISIVLVLLLFIWLAMFLSKTIREKKKAYIKLQEKNIEIQKQGEQLNEQSKLITKYQSQMNPHFVFNALNSLQGTVLNDEKDKTINQLQLFSQLMRQTLNNSENETITLETEINYLKTYINFEQQKFKKILKFEAEYPEDYSDILIPPMMIQPFVENSIKHAGLHTIPNPIISLKIVITDSLLKIVISDNGQGFNIEDNKIFKISHAIKIIQSRLQLIFQAANTELKHEYFEIQSIPKLEKGTLIKFYLPLNYKY